MILFCCIAWYSFEINKKLPFSKKCPFLLLMVLCCNFCCLRTMALHRVLQRSTHWTWQQVESARWMTMLWCCMKITRFLLLFHMTINKFSRIKFLSALSSINDSILIQNCICKILFQQEMEAIRTKLTQLEKQLAQREALVFTAQQLNMRVQAGEKLNEEDHQHLYAVVMSWWHILDEEQKRLKASCVNLIERERKNSKELQENRQELIQVKACSFWKVLVALFGRNTLLLKHSSMEWSHCAGFGEYAD